MWLPQAEALFDIRIIDTDAQSYLGQSPTQVISVAENEIKRKYLDAAAAHCAHFTPLCFSVDGVAGSEVASFLKRLSYCLSACWERSYANIMYWIRARLSFAILRDTARFTHSMALSGPGGWCKY